jgi:arsenate reductase-like glutaredoxin family protein
MIYVAKGRKIVDLDLTKDTAEEPELLRLILGPSGKLRAPTIKVGGSLLVGYSQEMFTSVLL